MERSATLMGIGRSAAHIVSRQISPGQGAKLASMFYRSLKARENERSIGRKR